MTPAWGPWCDREWQPGQQRPRRSWVPGLLIIAAVAALALLFAVV